MIDLYCERTGPGLWAEPLNAVTNLAFLLAAIFAYLKARRNDKDDVGLIALCAILFCIGLGSAAFHTLATRLASLADMLPILVFQLVYLGLYTSRVLMWDRVRIAAMFAGYVAATLLFAMLPQGWINGSLSYAPAFLFLGILAALHIRAGKDGRFLLTGAAGLLAVSLTFRSLDQIVCPVFPFGVHFLWHILNAVVLFLCIEAYRRNVAAR